MLFFSQCNLIVEASNNNIGCGDCVTLTAQGQVLNPVFEEDFNNGVEAVLVTKTHNPIWNPASIHDINIDKVKELFKIHTVKLGL